MRNLFLFARLLGALLLGSTAATAVQAASLSCYQGNLAQFKPAGGATRVLLVDKTTARDRAVSERDFRAAVALQTGSAGRIVLLAYAGHSPGQSLSRIDEWLLEAPLVDDAVIQDMVISDHRRLQSCLRKQKNAAQSGITVALDQLFSSMPIAAAERSEITYALRTVLHDFVTPDQATQVFHYSDAMQYSKGAGGRSFYGTGTQPRLIKPAVELAAMADETKRARADKPAGSFISLLWYGALLAPPHPGPKAKVAYLDSATIEAFRNFWSGYLQAAGVDQVQFGVPSLLNPDLRLPARP